MSLKIHEIENSYNTEIALIILLLRKYFQTTDTEEVNKFIVDRKDKIDWSTFKSIAAYHRIRPLLFKELVKVSCLDIHLRKSFIEAIKYFAFTNFQLLFETKRVTRIFQENGIIAIPYKGPILSKCFFGDYDSRESSDIDLLIQWKDLNKCIELLKKEGYRPVNDFLGYYGIKTRYLENEYNMDFYENGLRKFHIELHWEIGHPKLHPICGIQALFKLETSQTNPVGINISFSRASLAFASLMHHAIKDTFGILRNFTDLAKIFSSLTEEDLVEFKSYLQHASFHKQASVAEQISNHIFNLNLSTFSMGNQMNLKLFIHPLLESTYRYNSKKEIYFSFKKRLALENNKQTKIKILTTFGKLVLSPNMNDQIWLPLPKSLHFLYFILKPIRLCRKYLIGTIK